MKIKIALSLVALAFLPACDIHMDRFRHHAQRGALRQRRGRPGTGAARGRSGRYQRQPGLHSHAVAAQFRRGQPLADQRSARCGGAEALDRFA